MISQEVEVELEHRTTPIVHAPVELPICPECESKEAEFTSFDASCEKCVAFLNFHATISEMFAILRQWVPVAQQAVPMVICQMLDTGANVDDRDGLTDMTMLHYAVKSGTKGIGSLDGACKIVSLLISRGADPYARCRWTNMAAIHYAAYFDVSKVLELLLDATKAVDINSLCYEFDRGSPLHISCRTLALGCARVLVEHGVDGSIKDSNGKTAIELLPDLNTLHDNPEDWGTVSELRSLIENLSTSLNNTGRISSHIPREHFQISNTLKSLGLNIGDKVYVAGVKSGTLSYCGPTLFANGLWAGIELNEPVGKNNGSIDNIQYFKCPPFHGIFSPLSKITKEPLTTHVEQNNFVAPSKMDLTHVTAKVNSGLRHSRQDLNCQELKMAEVGDKVIMAGKKVGVVKFIGVTRFAPGVWYGIELTKPLGKNDGSVDGFRYFSCLVNHGIFSPPTKVQKIEKDHPLLSAKPTANKITKQNNGQNGVDENSRSNGIKPRIMATNSKLSPNTEPVLAEGTHVFCNGEIGVVQYMGSVSFAEGVWLGVELRTPKGKHDGMVQGRRYFTCRPGHGLLVRPSKVFVRGINGSKLITAN